MLIGENIKLALLAIRANKMRSFLTMLGIIIGISSVISITSIGDSARALLTDQFSSFGKNRMIIYADSELSKDEIRYEDLFQMKDIDNLKEKFKDSIAYIVPSVSGSSEVRVGRVESTIIMEGVDQDYDVYQNIEMLHGRMISGQDTDSRRNRIVIDEEGALKLFGRTDVLGESLTLDIDEKTLVMTIIGVTAKSDSIFASVGMSNNLKAYIPYTLFSSRLKDMPILDFYTGEGLDQRIMGNTITNYLAKVKDRQRGFYVFESTQLQQDELDKTLQTISVAVGAIAGISLVVGGIGIMNIMLVSVTERTREIGIRKALGAKRRDILLQFLIEAVILSVIGGIIGLVLGILLGMAGAKLADIELVVNPNAVITALIFSAMVGIFFGLYPANKAAKLNPIEALRYE
ncbi:ABC transporter permease [Proteocatella sphenisci]|uniref:ABC transporter permease n=1 Tax=Proteocatella sphenisci TaxID=181070 RepID=UPI000490D45E|nr:ABC transporter permease [Proteocatella sphenisci]